MLKLWLILNFNASIAYCFWAIDHLNIINVCKYINQNDTNLLEWLLNENKVSPVGYIHFYFSIYLFRYLTKINSYYRFKSFLLLSSFRSYIDCYSMQRLQNNLIKKCWFHKALVDHLMEYIMTNETMNNIVNWLNHITGSINQL